MKIEKNKVVALEYVLNVNGEEVDKATAERPLEFIQGLGYLLPLFESNIEGKEPGEAFSFTLTPENGYGEWHMENLIDLPKSAFEIDGQVREDLLFVGNVIPLMNGAGGVIPGKVVSIDGDKVKMDLNHPMAGKTLDFSGKILTVRDATEKELKEGLHGEFSGRHECSCHGGCGDCDGDCEKGNDGSHECKKGEGKQCQHGKCHKKEAE